jgi:hypothetical protein
MPTLALPPKAIAPGAVLIPRSVADLTISLFARRKRMVFSIIGNGLAPGAGD